MNYIPGLQFDLGAESQEEAQISVEMLQRKASQTKQRLDNLENRNSAEFLNLAHELASIQIDMDQPASAWSNAYPAFRMHITRQQWQPAIIVCDTLFRCNQPDSLIALGHSLWLSITFPVEPGLTVSQLQHVIDDTPEDSDGAAVAAAMAAYIVNLRTGVDTRDDCTLAVGQMLNQVARRHGNAHSQKDFDEWFKRLELDQLSKLLIRMRNIIDVLVQDQWWIDRDALQALIPAEN